MTTVRNRSYQRRRRGPIVAVITVLAVITGVTWISVLAGASGAGGSVTCPPTAAGPPPGESLSGDALNAVAPAPPRDIKLRVLNAGGQRGQANLVAAQFIDLGFGEAAQPDNDPFFPDGDMKCVGQIRFGPAGEGAASTVALLVPCAELVRDTRGDDTVDVSVGSAFGDLSPPRDVKDVLEQLGAPPAGSTDPDTDGGAPPAPVDPAELDAARQGSC